MNALVTGGCGFIGSHTVDKLINEGYNVTVIDNLYNGSLQNISQHKNNSAFTFVEASITDLEIIVPHFKNIDVVFHFAGMADIVPSIEKPIDYHNINVTGTLNVLEACRKNHVKRIIYAASSSCYGIPKHYPTNENEIIDCQYPYALSKYLGEQCCLHWSKVYQLNITSMRFFNVYGPRVNSNSTYGAVFKVFLTQKLNNKPFTIVGDGEQLRDFIFVSDVVNACFSASQNFNINSEVFNVGMGSPVSINYLTDLLGGEKTHIPDRPAEPRCTHADIRKIKSILNWQPKISFEEGVSIMLNHLNDYKASTLWEKESIAKATEMWFKHLKI